ncbi:MAG TPA: lyase family protein, partial [Bryobacteraceae bacterium]
MSTRLIDCLAATKSLSEIFSDRHILQTMLNFETALARVEAHVGVIPAEAASAIAHAAAVQNFDIDELVEASLRAGTPAIPLVRMLRDAVYIQNASAASFVHWGATSQDVVDTALIQLLLECRQVLEKDHRRLSLALQRISEEHANTVMLGRTLLQPAQPITFGLKAAGWFAALRRGWSRVESRFTESAY